MRNQSIALVDHAEVGHPAENPIPADFSFLRVAQRIVARGRFGHTRQHGVLCQIEFSQGLAIISLGRGFESISAMAKKYAIHVQLKNFFFAEPRLNLEGQQDLCELPEESLVKCQEVVSGDLHRQRGPATTLPAGQDQF